MPSARAAKIAKPVVVAKPVKVAKPAKVVKVAKAKTASEHPSFAVMITAAITSMAEKKGSSIQAIKKYICANYKVNSNYNTHLKMALKRGIEKEVFTQVKGTGASGSFKLAKAVKVAKPAAKKPAAKKPVAKKVVKKVTKASPKKKSPAKKVAKKPVAKKATKAKK